MRSVRLRLALFAACATLVAVTGVAYFLVGEVRRSLAEEIDESVLNQTIDYQDAILEFDDLATAPRPSALDSLFAVFSATGDIYVSNDTGLTAQELTPLADETFDVVVSDASFLSPIETTGADQMRSAVGELYLLDSGDDPVYVMFAESTASVDRTVDRLRNALLLAVPLISAFVGALAWLLTGRSLRPVDQMRREVDGITSSDLGQRVSEPGSTDEIGQLAATMNRMLGRLEQAKASQDQFVSDAAHELRTPLASIAAQLDVDAAHPATADSALTAARVRGEVTRLQTLIDGLLASARNADAPRPLPTSLVDLDVVVGEVVARVQVPAGITVDQGSVAIGTVRGDEQALSRMVDNLVANACRHAQSGIAVGVGTDHQGVWLRVEDDGAGVAQPDRERIFDRFVRLDEARTRDSGGSGLGLALARETVERHGGSITCSESETGGARFDVRLPAAR